MTNNSKEWIQYITASTMVASGIVLSFVSFFTQGDVTEGVLWYTAQGLTYAGGIFGVSVYFKTKLGESETRVKDYFNSRIHYEDTTEREQGG